MTEEKESAKEKERFCKLENIPWAPMDVNTSVIYINGNGNRNIR